MGVVRRGIPGFHRARLAFVAAVTLAALLWWGERGRTFASTAMKPEVERSDWPVYGGQSAGDHYSALRQINRENVGKLKVAWTFDTEEKGGLQTNPLIVGETLYACTPSQKVIALEGATGRKLWSFNAGTLGGQPKRGLSYWTDGAHSILFAGLLHELYALDPVTGKPIASFGDGGRIDLRKGLAETDASQNLQAQSFLAMTSPGVIYKDMIIVGFRAPETQPALHGDIRAYDVHTGALRWSFHTIPHPGEPGYETWPEEAWKTTGAANDWAGMALDERRGIVYAPTGSAVNDFYGGDRTGNDLYADTLLALDANTGRRIWHFQGVHHDIWDRDFPSPPSLVTVQSQGHTVDAVAQTTKQGFLFLFDRVTGSPLFPIEERSFPASTVPGEQTSSTQPVPALPAPYARQLLTAEMLTTRTPEAHVWALAQFKTFRSAGQFIPLGVDVQTVVFPGFDGGAEWGGSAVDPKTGVIYVNANDLAWTGELTENKPGGGVGSTVYQSQCSVCHGAERKGSPPAFPSLVGVGQRLPDATIAALVHQGKGRMPAFPNIEGPRLTALVQYLKKGGDEGASSSAASSDSSKREVEAVKREAEGVKREVESTPSPTEKAARYRFTGYKRFLDPDGFPAVAPPWGTLNAIDLNTGRYLWKVALGAYPELAAQRMKDTGSENYGGPIVTAGGVVFIGATTYDRKLRAFDSSTGALLWSADLPYAGNATPATYMIGGRQYVVIAASGQRDPKGPQGAAYVAFALP